MDAARFRRIETLFHAARVLPAARRGTFLDAECAEDPALRAHVLGLLAAESAGGAGPATELLERAGDAALNDAAAAQRGRVVGVWRLLQALGSGGMGTVWLAERNDGAYRTRAALKMLNPWLLGGEFERRFALERQILSDLKHPGIAALLDGGVGDDGVPYLVMEYVAGEPITHFAQMHNLDIAQRLRLLLPVCRAVQHAHQNLVIHRDLKPGNILVAADGSPKLLDFGIAKLLSGAAAAGAAEAPTRLLTPQYASPEQLANRPVTTASDVYSLGVILHELLVGARPQRDDADPLRPLTRPSSALLAAAPDADGDGDGDAYRLLRWARQLRGDLDTLLLKALAFEPARRYATAAQLGDDIERWLAHQPLRARPDTLRYRTAKFVRRHRLGVALAATALSAVLGTSIALAVLAQHLRDERDRSGAAQARAEREARAAQRVSGFLERLFDGANPNQTQGAAPSLRDVLDRGARDVAELDDDPAVQARLLVLMADAYRQLGEYAPGIAAAERAVALRRARVPVDAAELSESLDSLGELRRADAQYDAAERLHREALALRRGAAPADPVMVGRSLNNLALTLSQAGRGEESLPLFEESLALRRRVLGDDAAPVLATLVNIGLQRRALDDYAGAEAAFRDVYARRLAKLGEQHVATANVMTHLGHTRVARGAADEGEALLRRALEVRRKLLGARSNDAAIGSYELAWALQHRGRAAEAEPLLRDARAIELALFGPDHPETIVPTALLGEVLLARGQAAEAEPLLREALRVSRARLNPDHPRLAACASRLADALLLRGREDEAAQLYREALTIQRRKLPAHDGEIARTLLGLADIAQRRHDVAGARSLTQESAAILAAAPAEFDAARKKLQGLNARLAADGSAAGAAGEGAARDFPPP